MVVLLESEMAEGERDVDFVIRPRQGGKTFEVIEWLVRQPDTRCVVCATEPEADNVRHRVSEMLDSMESGVVAGWWRSQSGQQQRAWLKAHVVRFSGTKSRAIGFGHPSNWEYAVENIDLVLANYLRKRPSIVTGTGACR